jgi:thioredoxin-related protein
MGILVICKKTYSTAVKFNIMVGLRIKLMTLCLLLTANGLAGQAQSSPKKEPKYPSPAFGKVTQWETALSQAKLENKWVMIDCYTDWCGWCKVMDQKNFSDTQVQRKMNGFLNSYSLEMEKDSIGKLLRFHYGVNGFPAFLIFNGDGNFIGSYSGYSEKSHWMHYLDSMQTLKESTANDGKYSRPGVPTLNANNIPSWFHGFIFKRDYSIFEDTTPQGFVKRFKATTDPFQQFALYSVASYHCDDELVQRWIQNEAMYDSLFGKDWSRSTAYKVLGNQVSKAINSLNEKQFLWAMGELLKRSDHPEWDKPNQYMSWYKKRGEWSNYVTTFDEIAKNSSPVGLNSVAWELFQSCNEAAILTKAVEYSTISINKSPEWGYYDTRANLLYKLDRLSEAQIDANTAIKMGKDADANTAETQALLLKINLSKEKKQPKRSKQ